MEKTREIIRRSIFTFLKNYQYFISTASLLALPFTVSSLIAQSLVPSSCLFPIVHHRLRSLFLAAGFPPSSQLFVILNLKLSQTILNYVFVLPFSFSFLLLAKASVIQVVDCGKKQSYGSRISLLKPLIITQLCNSLVILLANAACFWIIVTYFKFFDVIGALSTPSYVLFLSAIGVIIYSIVLANSYIICNLALLLSGTEKRGGFFSLLKTCVLVQDSTATALSLAVPINLALAAIQALFQYFVFLSVCCYSCSGHDCWMQFLVQLLSILYNLGAGSFVSGGQ